MARLACLIDMPYEPITELEPYVGGTIDCPTGLRQKADEVYLCLRALRRRNVVGAVEVQQALNGEGSVEVAA